MNDQLMLIGLSQTRTDEDELNEALSRLSVSELHKLAFDLDPLSRTSRVDDLSGKIYDAERQGRELAHENSDLQKIAFIPALAAGAARLAPLAGRAMGALGGAKGIAGGIAKDMAISGAASKVMGALKPAAPAASAAGEVAGGFKYAFAGGLLQRAAGYVAKNPGTALTAAGAVGGAMMAPRDPQTGQKQYLKGALVGGVGAAGVNAVSNGALANKMRSSVMNRNNPLLGQGARRYLMDSAAATKGKVPVAGGGYSKAAPPPTSTTAARAPVAPSAAASPTQASRPMSPEWATAHSGVQRMREQASSDAAKSVGMGFFTDQSPISAGGFKPYASGPTSGNIKLSNMQTLTYDPGTKTFTRQHLTPSSGGEAMMGAGASAIPAGHTEAVRSSPQYGSRAYFQSRLQKAMGSAPRMASGTPSNAMRSVGNLASKLR